MLQMRFAERVAIDLAQQLTFDAQQLGLEPTLAGVCDAGLRSVDPVARGDEVAKSRVHRCTQHLVERPVVARAGRPPLTRARIERRETRRGVAAERLGCAEKEAPAAFHQREAMPLPEL